MRFTIWRKTFRTAAPGEAFGALDNSMIVGTHPGNTEEEALEHMAVCEGDADFKSHCARLKIGRGNYDLLHIKE